MNATGYFPGVPAFTGRAESAQYDNRPTRSMMDIWKDLKVQIWSLNPFVVIPNSLFSSWSQPQKEEVLELMTYDESIFSFPLLLLYTHYQLYRSLRYPRHGYHLD